MRRHEGRAQGVGAWWMAEMAARLDVPASSQRTAVDTPIDTDGPAAVIGRPCGPKGDMPTRGEQRVQGARVGRGVGPVTCRSTGLGSREPKSNRSRSILVTRRHTRSQKSRTVARTCWSRARSDSEPARSLAAAGMQ